VVEATGIRDIPSGPLLRIGDDRFVPGLSRLVETVRQASRGRTRLFIQIIDFLTVRRRPEPEKYFMRYLEVTDPLRVQLALWLDDKRWREAPEDEVRRFLREAARVTLDVLAAVRARVGPDYPVGIRYLGDEVVEGGSRVDDAVWFGIKFAEGGVDYLSVSKGGRFEDAKQPKIGEAVYPYTGESGYECMPTVLSDARGPFGRNVPLAAAIRRALRGTGHTTPVVTSGGITTFEQAEGILERGEA